MMEQVYEKEKELEMQAKEIVYIKETNRFLIAFNTNYLTVLNCDAEILQMVDYSTGVLSEITSFPSKMMKSSDLGRSTQIWSLLLIILLNSHWSRVPSPQLKRLLVLGLWRARVLNGLDLESVLNLT